jgi:hypothetical protein
MDVERASIIKSILRTNIRLDLSKNGLGIRNRRRTIVQSGDGAPTQADAMKYEPF